MVFGGVCQSQEPSMMPLRVSGRVEKSQAGSSMGTGEGLIQRKEGRRSGIRVRGREPGDGGVGAVQIS